jgi:hypothetical protein
MKDATTDILGMSVKASPGSPCLRPYRVHAVAARRENGRSRRAESLAQALHEEAAEEHGSRSSGAEFLEPERGIEPRRVGVAADLRHPPLNRA